MALGRCEESDIACVLALSALIMALGKLRVFGRCGQPGSIKAVENSQEFFVWHAKILEGLSRVQRDRVLVSKAELVP